MPENNANTDESVQATDLLAAHLHQLDIDGLFKTVKVLKETEWERTELICDNKGTYYVRKYLSNKDGFGTAYTALMNMACPCFPKIYACYPLSDSLVVIMEYLKGTTLRNYVEERGALNHDEASRILHQISEGLIELHGMRPTPMIHRDVNPANIIVSDDSARLIDFGIARRYDASAKRDTHAWGTQGYAPPEQFGFGQSDERTDVYALGMVLYFMLTAHDPEPDVQDKVASRVEIGSEQSLYAVIQRAITLDKTYRYSSVREFVDALDALNLQETCVIEFVPPQAEDRFVDFTDSLHGVTSSSNSSNFAPPKPSSAVFVSKGSDCAPATDNRMSSGLWLRGRMISTPLRYVWITWQGVCAFLFVFVLIACIAVIADIVSNNSSDLVPALACYGSVAFCFFAPVCIVACNFCNVFGRISWLGTHRWIKAVLFIVGMTVLGCILIAVFYGLYSPEYFATFNNR